MVDRTVDGDVQLDMRTERDVDAGTRDVPSSPQRVLDAGSEAQGPPEAASPQVVVGDIPREPPGFLSRTALLTELDRAGARVSVIHPAAGLHGVGPRRRRPPTREPSWTKAGGWWRGSTARTRAVCERDWRRWLTPRD